MSERLRSDAETPAPDVSHDAALTFAIRPTHQCAERERGSCTAERSTNSPRRLDRTPDGEGLVCGDCATPEKIAPWMADLALVELITGDAP
jgi:hypothetical protein